MKIEALVADVHIHTDRSISDTAKINNFVFW